MGEQVEPRAMRDSCLRPGELLSGQNARSENLKRPVPWFHGVVVEAGIVVLARLLVEKESKGEMGNRTL